MTHFYACVFCCRDYENHPFCLYGMEKRSTGRAAGGPSLGNRKQMLSSPQFSLPASAALCSSLLTLGIHESNSLPPFGFYLISGEWMNGFSLWNKIKFYSSLNYSLEDSEEDVIDSILSKLSVSTALPRVWFSGPLIWRFTLDFSGPSQNVTLHLEYFISEITIPKLIRSWLTE